MLISRATTRSRSPSPSKSPSSGELTRPTKTWPNGLPDPLTGTNTPPSAPGGLRATNDGTGWQLIWNAASDAQTPPGGLSYQVRIGSSPGGSDLLTPSRVAGLHASGPVSRCLGG